MRPSSRHAAPAYLSSGDGQIGDVIEMVFVLIVVPRGENKGSDNLKANPALLPRDSLRIIT